MVGCNHTRASKIIQQKCAWQPRLCRWESLEAGCLGWPELAHLL